MVWIRSIVFFLLKNRSFHLVSVPQGLVTKFQYFFSLQSSSKSSSVPSGAFARICDCTVVLTSSSSSSTIALLQHPLDKELTSFSWAAKKCLFIRSLPEVVFWLFLEHLCPQLTWSSLPAWLPRESSDLSGLEPGSPPWILDFPWVSLGHCSHSLASRPDYLSTIWSK